MEKNMSKPYMIIMNNMERIIGKIESHYDKKLKDFSDDYEELFDSNESNISVIVVENPKQMILTGQGVAPFPLLMDLCKDDVVYIQSDKILSIKNLKNEVEKGFIQSTTDIQIADTIPDGYPH